MNKWLMIFLSLVFVAGCQPTYKTSYGIDNASGAVVDLRSANIVVGTQEQIERMYTERIKQKTDGEIILKFVEFPVYPRDMLEAGIDAEVYIEFSVNKKGRVENPQVIWSSYDKFNEVSVKAIKKWRFEPIIKNGEPVTAKLKHAFKFRISET